MTQRKSTWEWVGTSEVSDEWLDLVPGHSVPRWLTAHFFDPTGVYPPVMVQAEIRGEAGGYRAVISRLWFGDGEGDVKAAHLRAFGPMMHDLAERLYDYLTLTELDENLLPVTPRETFRRVLRKASRAPGETMIQRQDEALRRWETEFEPEGKSQRDAAFAMRMKYSTFRSYLTHARNRRGN